MVTWEEILEELLLFVPAVLKKEKDYEKHIADKWQVTFIECWPGM